MSPEELEHELAAGRRHRLYVIVGDEDFLAREAAERIRLAHLGSAEHIGDVRFAPQADRPVELARVIEELGTTGLFASDKVVTVLGAEALVAEGAEALADLVPALNAGHALVLLLAKLDRRRKAHQRLLAAGALVEIPVLYPTAPPWKRGGPAWDNDYARFVRARLRERGLACEPAVAQALVERVGASLGEIAAEADRLAAVLGRGAKLDLQTLEAHTADRSAGALFRTIDALLQRRAAEATQGLARLLERGLTLDGKLVADPQPLGLMLVSLLAKRCQRLRQARALQQEGLRGEELAERLGLRRAFAADFQIELRAQGAEALAAATWRLVAADAALKRGGDPGAVLATLFHQWLKG